MATQIQFRRGTASAWTSANPLLAQGEPGFETDTLKWKVGNGTQNWTALPYTLGSVAPISYGTTLPGSPTDGQEAILVDSTTNPSYQWRFRYNAGSSSAYKWEFVGGASLLINYLAVQTPASGGSWVGMVGTDFAAPRAGDWRYSFATRIYTPSTAGVAVAGTANASVGSSPVGPYVSVSLVSGGFGTVASTTLFTAVSVNNTLRLVANNNISAQYDMTSVEVLPRRVS